MSPLTEDLERRIAELEEDNQGLREKVSEAEKDVMEEIGVMENIDGTVHAALKELGLRTCEGHGFPCRVDELIAGAKRLASDNARLTARLNRMVSSAKIEDVQWRPQG